jgi:ketosteroid isomerase-like protein
MTPTQTVQSVYDAFNRGDVAHIVSLVAPNAVWRQSKEVPWGGDYRGPQGASEFFTKLANSVETLTFVPQENIAVGNEVFSFGTYSAKGVRSGKVGTSDWMFRWKVENGKIVSYESYLDSAALAAAV